MTKAHHFAALAAAHEMAWPTVEGRVLLITGQSRLTRSPLSPIQEKFLAEVTPLGFEPVYAGLPFRSVATEAAPNLLTAALTNARQFLWVNQQPAYAELIAGALSPLLASSRAAMIVTGSMGLSLLHAAWPRLKNPVPDRLSIVCLGPVGPAPTFAPDVVIEVVQGVRDGWSQCLYRGPVTHRIACGHLDYWQNPEAQQVARSAAAQLLERSNA